MANKVKPKPIFVDNNKKSSSKSTSSKKSVLGYSSIIILIVAVIIAFNGKFSYHKTGIDGCDNGYEMYNGKCILVANIPRGANPEGKPREATSDCNDRHNECKEFAKFGECEKNPGWMTIFCPRSCQTCHLRDPKIRCDRNRLGIITDPVYNPGDMSAMFQSIEERFSDRYDIEVKSVDPWIITLDNFLNDAEIEALISTQTKWERSTDTGSTNEFGETGRILSSGRTSSNSWCTADCVSHPEVQSIIKKIEEVTLVPSDNYESFQVLRYDLG
jgi:hypothetical protein